MKKTINSIRRLQRKILGNQITSHYYHIVVDDIGRFKGKSVLVTGGTGAIGSAICFELASMGAIVGLCGRNTERINATLNIINKESEIVASNIIPIELDVNNDEQIEATIKGFANSQGKLDVIINNAGGQPGRVGDEAQVLCDKPIDQIDQILDTNLRSVLVCSRTACKIMREQEYGHIISMASVIGIGGKANYSDYAASKGGIIAFTRSLALEMARYNVRVNCISPGTVHQIPFDCGSVASYTDLNPLHRRGYTKEIADTVSFLIYNEYINGQNIIVDGGRSIGLFGDN